MIKVFTTNKNGKIELTKDELKKLLDEAYWEGYRANSNTYTYHTPNWDPYCWNTTTAATSGTGTGCVSTITNSSNDVPSTLTLESNTITGGAVGVECGM